jgi:hypothetical protein
VVAAAAVKPAEAMTGVRAMMGGHLAIVTINVTVSSSANNLDFRTLIVNAGWNQVTPVNATVTINAGVFVGSSSTANPAFTVQGSFPSNSKLNLVNNGYISGAGGAGGRTDYELTVSAGAGNAGGPALSVSIPVNVTNNGYNWGGGGGGGGAWTLGGGGGGGTVVGGGGAGNVGSAEKGHSGTATAGGNGGAYVAGEAAKGGNPGIGATGTNTSSSGCSSGGGGGGSPGYSGGPGGGCGTGYGAAAGLPGYYIVGNSNVTWVVTGTRLGRIS